jgi:uncharacterized membrane protein YgdD (TMEM256/DUF423 family)
MPISSRIFSVAGSLFLAVGVALGAWGAHGLTSVLTPEKLKSWELAVQYQMVHALGLIMLGYMLRDSKRSRLRPAAGWLMLTGIFLFSGSIYLGALGGTSWTAQIAPFGGGSFMLAWLLIAVAAIRD